MPKNAVQSIRKTTQLREGLADLHIEALKQFAPRSTERLINSGIELLEAHRELLAERIARLQRAKARISSKAGQSATRKVTVRQRNPASAKTASA